jgi:(E)-4-hydroxy-3-methylbut-2-enyl-diphosphate synthase
MVESALEFLRICEDLNYYNIVLSMKASNTRVMVQAYRLLVQKLDEEGLKPYPLHLGVTEAGEAEDGRIKSAVGIGTLLEDGLGDTIRVSLTEEPELEAPVAIALARRYSDRLPHDKIIPINQIPIDPFKYSRRNSHTVMNFGGKNEPRVVTDVRGLEISEYKDLSCCGHHYMSATDKFVMGDYGADYVYSGDSPIPFMLPNGLREIVDYKTWSKLDDKASKYPMLVIEDLKQGVEMHHELSFIHLSLQELDENIKALLIAEQNLVLVLNTDNKHGMPELRRAFFELMNSKISHPVIIQRSYSAIDRDKLLLYSSTDIGGLLIDGLGDGVMLSSSHQGTDSKDEVSGKVKFLNSTSFGILQAARTRMTKTEYISCPSCGRTLFDLQETTSKIRRKTDHLKGVKIGIMGCIVNGPGEMADADFGYVGSGKGKITLYKGMDVVKRGVPSENAVEELINIIKEDGRWVEPETLQV